MIIKLSAETSFDLTSVQRILLEYKSLNTVKFLCMTKVSVILLDDTWTTIDEFSKNVIRQKIHYFLFNREIPTLQNIISAVAELTVMSVYFKMDINVQTVKRTLIYFHEKKKQNSVLTDREDLITWRRNYLKDIRKYREGKRTIYGWNLVRHGTLYSNSMGR